MEIIWKLDGNDMEMVWTRFESDVEIIPRSVMNFVPSLTTSKKVTATVDKYCCI